MKNIRLIIFRTCLFLLLCMMSFPERLLAQTIPDAPSIEAYIYDHKKQRSLLRSRAVLEESNKLLHKISQETTCDFKEINIDLDKYTRAFDIIDLVFNTVSTGFNVYHTYDNISDKIVKYKNLIEDYNQKILLRGRIETADTLLIYVNKRAIDNLVTECNDLYGSITILSLYASNKVCCTTGSLMLMVDNINKSLDRINEIVNEAYFQSWQFIMARTHYWKGELYRSKTMREVANEAFERWVEASKITDY